MLARIGIGLFLLTLLPYPARTQKSSAAPPSSPAAPLAQVAQEVRAYRLANEDRIVRELAELLAIPNVATDTKNIERNATKLIECSRRAASRRIR